MRVEITDAVIPATEIVAEIKAGPDGAVCVFDGIVRDHTRGRKTLHLDYEAYREMALEQMRGLAGEAVTRFGVRDVTLVHRLGRLFVGETSVLVVVASAHRGAAFDACRWLIDTLKKTVPIWKKEQFVDGAIWADGEAFPSGVGVQGSAVNRGEESGRPSDDAHISESRYGAPGSVAEREVEGRPSDDAHSSESMYGAPGSVAEREVEGRPSDDAHTSESMYGAPGSVAEREAEGRPSDDAHTSESMYGAPGFVGARKLEAGE